MNETTEATPIFAPIWRRKWLILLVGILVAAATYLYYKHQPTVYTASTQIYLGGGTEEQGLLNSTQSKITLDDRDVTDQATLINSNSLGEPVHQRLRSEHHLAAARGKAHASASSGSDFITIAAEARTSKGAEQLADAYAAAYVKRQHTHYRREVSAAIAATRRQLNRIEAGLAAAAKAKAKGKGGAVAGAASGAATVQAANLASKINQLEGDLEVAGVQEISSGKTKATLVSPTPKRNAIFGFVLGILLAAAAAYLLSRFDRRLRSLASIEAAFGTPVLSALPAVRQPVVRTGGEPAPAEGLLEPLRRLHTTLQLGDMLEHDRERAPRLILFLSADAGDGKSTLLADLALVQRDAGARVAVIEADMRRPVLAGLLGVNAPYGLSDVLAGALSLGEAWQSAMHLQTATVAPSVAQGVVTPSGAAQGFASEPGLAQSVATVPAAGQSFATAPGAGQGVSPPTVGSRGSVSVLLSGGHTANPPALLAGERMRGVLRAAAEDFDYVLIDAPPPLQVSDALPLLGLVDGIVLVARAGHTHEAAARRLMQLLARVSSAPVLGVLANCVSRAEVQEYGFGAPYGQRRGLGGLVAR
ncbi:MAG TPA: Wzz/FepE/Etk N-terminal domain-containing protein [Solirubrobacteraceae bacterium]|jgi:Mrp family chromosome partitioning ATPase|nr:Wzz/FepE/Etk N-terminal domain-containing protein [Solirubrobacteraceae bacterium]